MEMTLATDFDGTEGAAIDAGVVGEGKESNCRLGGNEAIRYAWRGVPLAMKYIAFSIRGAKKQKLLSTSRLSGVINPLMRVV